MVFTLLTAVTASPPNTPTLTLSSGHILTRSSPTALPSSSTALYTCISYAWGADYIPNPLTPSAPAISTRTLPALATTLLATARAPQPVWIDALCVPPTDPDRRACLVGMSSIYRHAARILIILSAATADYLYTPEAEITDEMIETFDNDAWVTRAWTYQEFAISDPNADICFAAEGAGERGTVTPMDLLNKMGTTVRDYKRRHPNDDKKWRNLGAFEELIVDYLMSNYVERSALCSLGSVDRRTQGREEDRYYSIMGLVGDVDVDRLEELKRELSEPAEMFMKLCEEKGDYSLVFVATADRGGSWRPRAGKDFRTVLPWSICGVQKGQKDAAGILVLMSMRELSPAAMDAEARRFVMASPVGLGEIERLRGMGFNGHGKRMETESGLFFAQTEWSTHPEAEVVVLVPTKLYYVWGAPAMLAVKDVEGCRFVSSGLFVGPTSAENYLPFKGKERFGGNVRLV